MNQEKDLMSIMKRLKNINQKGGPMTPEEREWFNHSKKESGKMEALAKASVKDRS